MAKITQVVPDPILMSFILSDFKKLEPMFTNVAHNILIVWVSKSMHHFRGHLILTYCTLQFIGKNLDVQLVWWYRYC